MSTLKATVDYFDYVYDTLATIAGGMAITLRHFFKSWLAGGDVTLEYPEERPTVAHRYRGIHVLDVETCIACLQCAKACPIDCIVIRVDRNKATKEVAFHEFSIDYNKCMFCHLCIEPCPVECIDMSRTYEFNVFNREELVLDLRKPMHQYDSQAEGGTDKGRESSFMPGFVSQLTNILKPREHFEGQDWSRTAEHREYKHAKISARLSGLEDEVGLPQPKSEDEKGS